ncbi:MAG: prolyl aminopeptidase [Acidimicrobiales bacterium]|nr:prolyl aminopeptidase [Acidimicrobiales bacterium]
MSERRPFYPEIEPYDTGMLAVSDLHSIYFEESGNPDGKPAVFLHGGPGAGSNPKHRRLWDPTAYRIIVFDQRGCGRSTPHAELRENTTWDLVADMERLRDDLGIDRWQVFGGSWGSTLALAYSQTYPDRVTEIILRGIFLLRPWEIQWFYQRGASAIFPDLFAAYCDHVAPEEQDDLLSAYHRRLNSDDPAVVSAAAAAWSAWEGSTLSLLPRPDLVETFTDHHLAVSLARIESHYFVNGGWFESEDQLLRNVDWIRDIPAVIVHGRYDVITPIQNAWDLKQAWPEAELIISPDAGHSFDEPANLDVLIRATDRFRP